jgi:hypothetical protein
LKADFIASLPYAAMRLRMLLILNVSRDELGWSAVGGLDPKMLSHPPRERSARRAALADEKQIEKKFFRVVSFEMILRVRCGAVSDTANSRSAPRRSIWIRNVKSLPIVKGGKRDDRLLPERLAGKRKAR